MPGLATKKKELYLGKCLDDLHKLSEIKPLGNNVTIIAKSADRVFRDAQTLDTQGDEERAFVMYIKYFNIIKQIKAKADYKKQKDYFDNLLGKKNQLKAIERAEKLSDNLKERYDQKEAEAVVKKLDNLEASEKAKKSTQAEKANNETYSAKTSTEAKAPGSITCTDLCGMLRDKETNVTVMDVRSQSDFSSSHISHTKCVSVPEDILLPGSTVTHIVSKLPSESHEMWSQRQHADHIVLLDWRSRLDDVTVGTPLRTLKDALFKFDQSTIIKSEPLVLEGGYEQWLLCYPTMTTNAHVARPSDGRQPKPGSPTITLDFDYPDLDENLKKKSPPVQPANGLPSVPSSFPMPSFDRSLKPSRASVEPVANNTLTSDKPSPSTSENSLDQGKGLSDAGSTLYPSIRGETKLNNLKPEKNNKPINVSVRNDLAEDLIESVVNRQQKESELQDFEASRDLTLREDQHRVEETEKRLRDLENMKRKEERDVADLLRMKRKLKEEIDQQKQQQNEHRLKLSQEEEQRKLALEYAKVEEEERKQRMSEVERMREERKRQEQQRDLARRQSEDDDRKDTMADETAKRDLVASDIAREEEENVSGATDHSQITEEEQREREKSMLLEKKKREEEEEKERLRKEEDARKEQEKQQKLRDEEQRRRELERLEEERKRKELERHRVEEERKKRELERQRVEEERKRKELEEAQERQKREVQARENAAKDRLEQERRDRERQAALASKSAGQASSKTVPSSNLPTGWEKRLDRATNRYFYIDHNRGLTHWTPPQMLNNNNSPARAPGDTYTVRLKEEPSISSSRGMSRSHSSPDIMKQLAQEEEEAQKVLPAVNRGTKPTVSVAKANNKLTAYALRKRDLNPVYGNVGAALTGLKNLGNTCYMNSTIQCLNNTSPLISYFLNDSYLHDINRASSTGMHGEVVDDFAVVIKALWSQQYRSITPRDLKHTIGKYNPMFAGYQQQDSQEFLTFLLDGLHEGLNEIRSKPQIPEQSNDNILDREAAAIAWKHHKMLHKSIIVELFQGQLKSTLMCRTCGKTSVTFQAFMFLSLPIPASSRCSLKECIKEFVKPEMMTGSSRWKCPRCRVERDSEKKIDIWKLPHILLIGLNRFYSEGMWMQKKTTYVDFPLNDLDLSGYIAGPPPRNSYNLYGTSNHYGTMEGGHYTAFCRNPVNKKWFKFDDHDVYEMSSSDVKTSAAFVLYYTAIDLPAPQYKPRL